MEWVIRYTEKGKELSLTLNGNAKDVEVALEIIKAKHGSVIKITNSEGRVYFPMTVKTGGRN